MDDYQALKAFGFSPAKAAEILLDVSRGNTIAFMWLSLARAEACKWCREADEIETPAKEVGQAIRAHQGVD